MSQTNTAVANTAKKEAKSIDIALPSGFKVIGLTATPKDGVDLNSTIHYRSRTGRAKIKVSVAKTELEKVIKGISKLSGYEFQTWDVLAKKVGDGISRKRVTDFGNVSLMAVFRYFETKEIIEPIKS